MKSPAVTIATGKVYELLRIQSVLTIENCEDAVEHVYKLWEARGMFGCQCHETHAEFAAPMLTALRDRSEVVEP